MCQMYIWGLFFASQIHIYICWICAQCYEIGMLSTISSFDACLIYTTVWARMQKKPISDFNFSMSIRSKYDAFRCHEHATHSQPFQYGLNLIFSSCKNFQTGFLTLIFPLDVCYMHFVFNLTCFRCVWILFSFFFAARLFWFSPVSFPFMVP